MKIIQAIALSAVIFVAACANAEPVNSLNWALDASNSKVNFTTIKKGNIAEVHTFSDISGNVTDGIASIIIRPDSVDSRVPIRNERMREFLFETGLYPTIEVTAPAGDIIKGLKAGDSGFFTVPASLLMHGIKKELDLELRITKLNSKTLVVASTQPVLIRAADFNMLKGVTALSALVNNLPIAETVPVNFSVLLNSN